MSKTSEQISQAREPFTAAIQAKFEKGLLLHQQGKLVEAEQLYVEVLLTAHNLARGDAL